MTSTMKFLMAISAGALIFGGCAMNDPLMDRPVSDVPYVPRTTPTPFEGNWLLIDQFCLNPKDATENDKVIREQVQKGLQKIFETIRGNVRTGITKKYYKLEDPVPYCSNSNEAKIRFEEPNFAVIWDRRGTRTMSNYESDKDIICGDYYQAEETRDKVKFEGNEYVRYVDRLPKKLKNPKAYACHGKAHYLRYRKVD